MDETVVDNNEFQLGLLSIIFQLIDIFNSILAGLTQAAVSGFFALFN